MVEPVALAETVTPPIFSPPGAVTVPVRIEGSAANAAVVNAALASSESAVRFVMPDVNLRGMMTSPALDRVNATDWAAPAVPAAL